MLDRILSHLSDLDPWKPLIQYYPVSTSTNDVLKQIAQRGAPHGTVLIAGSQTGGRGRMGRSFSSPPDAGVYMSVLLRPNCRPDALMHLTCAAALAACDAIEQAAGFRPGIKWTNDIIYRKKKLAGILTEMGFDASGFVSHAVIGIGINCCQTAEDFPDEIRQIAGSLAMFSARKIDQAAVAAKMIEAFQRMGSELPQRESILSRYRRDCITIGQEVSVHKSDLVRYGKALDIDDAGALIVAFSDGSVEAVNSGEVSVRSLNNYV